MLRLKELRAADGLSQTATAKKFDLFQQTYARYENEETQAPYDILLDIADYYGVSLDYLFGRTDEKAVNVGQSLTAGETRLLRAYKDLIPPMQELMLTMVENAAAQPQNRRKEA